MSKSHTSEIAQFDFCSLNIIYNYCCIYMYALTYKKSAKSEVTCVLLDLVNAVKKNVVHKLVDNYCLKR